MSICAPVVSVMRRIVCRRADEEPIFSGSIWMVWMRGAYLLRSARGRQRGEHRAEISMRASRAWEDRGLGDLEGQAVDLEV